MPEKSQYFIAIIPPKEVATEITSFKQEMADIYNSKKALRVMPHITLKAPFTIPNHQDTEVSEWFFNIETDIKPFEITLDGFGAFDNPKNPVLFVKPEFSAAMNALQKDILNAFKKQFPNIPAHFHEEEFHPHMTIAYRDLAYAEFEKAWAAFKNRKYPSNFVTNGFYLLKHNGECWEVLDFHELKAQ